MRQAAQERPESDDSGHAEFQQRTAGVGRGHKREFREGKLQRELQFGRVRAKFGQPDTEHDEGSGRRAAERVAGRNQRRMIEEKFPRYLMPVISFFV